MQSKFISKFKMRFREKRPDIFDLFQINISAPEHITVYIPVVFTNPCMACSVSNKFCPCYLIVVLITLTYNCSIFDQNYSPSLIYKEFYLLSFVKGSMY